VDITTETGSPGMPLETEAIGVDRKVGMGIGLVMETGGMETSVGLEMPTTMEDTETMAVETASWMTTASRQGQACGGSF